VQFNVHGIRAIILSLAAILRRPFIVQTQVTRLARSRGKHFTCGHSRSSTVAEMIPWRGVIIHTILVLTQPTYLAVRYHFDHDYFSSTGASWFALGAIIWTYIVTKASIPFFTSPLHHLPSPPGERFPIGHLDFNKGKPPTGNVEKMFGTPNDGLLVLWAGYLWCQIIPTRPDTVMDLLNTHNYDWEKPAGSRKFLTRTLGEGLVVTEGNTHRAMRKVVAPAFSGHHIRDLVPLFYTKGLAFTDSLAREVAKSTDGAVEMMAQMSRVTLDIIGAAGIGKDFNTIENDKHPLADLYARITRADRGPLWLFVLINTTMPTWFIQRLKGTPYARIEEARRQLRAAVRDLIQEKRRSSPDKLEKEKDIISIILRSGDFSDDYLVDQLLTFLAAG